MERVDEKPGNAKQHLFDGIDLDRVYYSAFGDINYADENVLPYSEEIQYHKEVEVKKASIESLYKYFGANIVVPGKYSIPVLARVKYRKRYASGNPVGEEHSNPIPDTRVHEL